MLHTSMETHAFVCSCVRIYWIESRCGRRVKVGKRKVLFKNIENVFCDSYSYVLSRVEACQEESGNLVWVTRFWFLCTLHLRRGIRNRNCRERRYKNGRSLDWKGGLTFYQRASCEQSANNFSRLITECEHDGDSINEWHRQKFSETSSN